MAAAACSPQRVSGLGEGLDDDEGGDAGAATVGHQGGQRGYGAEVGDLVEDECERWLEAAAGVVGGELAGGLGDVFEKGGDERRGGAGADAGAEEVDGAAVGDEGLGIEAFAFGGSKDRRTAGSASAERAERTPAQMASRVRPSMRTMPSRVSPQPSAASSERLRMVTASMAEAGSRLHR